MVVQGLCGTRPHLHRQPPSFVRPVAARTPPRSGHGTSSPDITASCCNTEVGNSRRLAAAGTPPLEWPQGTRKCHPYYDTPWKHAGTGTGSCLSSGWGACEMWPRRQQGHAGVCTSARAHGYVHRCMGMMTPGDLVVLSSSCEICSGTRDAERHGSRRCCWPVTFVII